MGILSDTKSSKNQRTTHRINAGLEIIDRTLATVSPTACIPTKTAQAIMSVSAIFGEDTKPLDKILHGLQASIATVQVGILISSMFLGLDCAISGTALCIALTALELVYQGILLTGWGISEIHREPSIPQFMPQFMPILRQEEKETSNNIAQKI